MEATMLTSLHQRKSSPVKKPKQKKKPIKVRYISNPMKVETSASCFMALVQELTGQYAADLPAVTSQTAFGPGGADPVVSGALKSYTVEDNQGLEVQLNDQAEEEPSDVVDHAPECFEPLDGNVFMHRMVEDFSGSLRDGLCDVGALGSIDSL